MRGHAFVLTLTLSLTLAATEGARGSPHLRVQPLLTPADAARLEARGTLAHAPVLRPDEQHQLARRSQRWRGFHDILSRPGIDWSPAARRRSGWRPRPTRAAGAAGVAALPPDTLHVAFIRIDFRSDRGGGASTGDGHFDLSGPDSTVPPVDPPPRNRTFYLRHLEALKRYNEAQSYGRTIIEGDVWPRTENGAYSVSDMADFGPWEFSQDIYRAAVTMFQTMMLAADSQSVVLGDRIPWNRIDRFVLIHAGSDFQSDLSLDSEEDIPTFTLGVIDSDMVVFRDVETPGDSVRVDRAAIVPETQNQDGYFGALNGVLAHECGHLFYGFFDVYDIETGQPIVGWWSLMDSGNLLGSRLTLSNGSEIFATGLLPPSIDPFQRSFTSDALDLPEVTFGAPIALANSERFPDVRRVRLSSDEFLLLENRYIAPRGSTLDLDRDSTTRVVLGPVFPDRFEYDALLPGGGTLVWHVDISVIALEYSFPLDTSLRVNPDFGINTNPQRLGLSVIEADGLADLGDPGSPLLFGAKFDPYFLSNNATLSDSTAPNLIPHTGTRPHLRLDFLDDPGPVMRFTAARAWQLPGWPIVAEFPPGGPRLLAVDADGDRRLEVCWAGGDSAGPDSAAVFAVRVDGQGLSGPDPLFAQLDVRVRPVLAALPTGQAGVGGLATGGPSLFAVTTYAVGADTSMPGGRVWLLDHFGQPVPGWPPPLPSLVTTPPVIAGSYPFAVVMVGCADGHVYALDLDGNFLEQSNPPLPGRINGRLATWGFSDATRAGLVAAGGADGDVAVYDWCLSAGCPAPAGSPRWQHRVGASGFTPDFLWIDFDGAGSTSGANARCPAAGPELVVHDASRLWAFCPGGEALPGWGRDQGDTLVSALGAGDPDGDGFPEVLTQSVRSRLAFINADGYPSPGWPKRATREDLTTASPPLALDLDGDRRSEVVAMNGSGILAALRLDGRMPPGWPLATGAGAAGSPVAADLDQNGLLEIVAPDHLGHLYAYALPDSAWDPMAIAWPMLGGDPGRSSALPADRTASAPAARLGPLVQGSLKAYPNPARRRPVQFAFQLTEPAEVEFRILDTSGHAVASFKRSGRQADNLEVWDPGDLPAGLYLAQLRFRSAGREHHEILQVGLLR